MKKVLNIVFLLIAVLIIGGCESGLDTNQSQNEENSTQETTEASGTTESEEVTESSEEEVTELKIGVSPTTTLMLEAAKESIEELGYDLEIVAFDDFVAPNTSLIEGSIDANAFQHKAYLTQYNQDNNQDLPFVQGLYITLCGLYSNKYESFEDIEQGSTVGIFQDASNQDRAVRMLEEAGLVTVEDTGEPLKSIHDIVENPLNLEFITLDINQTVNSLNDVDLAFIMSQQLLQSEVEAEYELALENPDEQIIENYSVGLVTRNEDTDAPYVDDIIAAFNSEKTRNNLDEVFGDSVQVVIE